MCDKCKDAMHKHYVCKCGKEFDNGISLQHHEMSCLKYKEWKKEQKNIRESKRLPNGLFKCENPGCTNEHDGSYGSGRFCCNKCRRIYSGLMSNATMNNNGIRKIVARKAANTIHKNINDGTYIPIGHSQSKETREKLSIARSRILDNPNSGGFKDVKWYHVSNLNGEDFVVRGHWEENVANRLNSNGVLWVRNRWLHYIRDGISRTYNPDFYLPNTNEYIEVKGYYSESDKEKMRLVLENNPGIRIYFIGQKQYQDFIDGKIILNDSLLLT